MTGMRRGRVRAVLLGLAAALLGAAIFLPLWGMTLVSVQYPEGLRLVVYPLRMTGDLREINALNTYIGMAKISPEFFVELRVIAGLFACAAVASALAAVLRRWWASLVPLGLLCVTAVFGLWRMWERLYDYGHQLDPAAPIEIQAFMPRLVGSNQIAQFATYSYFTWGTTLALAATSLVAAALWLDLRSARSARPEG